MDDRDNAVLSDRWLIVRRPVIAIGVLLVLLLGGLVASIVRNDNATEPSAVASSTESPASEETTQAPAPSPESAAVAAVAMTAEVARAGFISRRELIESFTTKSFGRVLADDTSEQMAALSLEFSERQADPVDLQVTEQPLRVRISSSTMRTASVDVWSVLVVALPTAATARVLWRTVKIDLVLVDDRWLVDGWKSLPGPTPMVDVESPISSATDVRHVLEWTPVMAAVA